MIYTKPTHTCMCSLTVSIIKQIMKRGKHGVLFCFCAQTPVHKFLFLSDRILKIQHIIYDICINSLFINPHVDKYLSQDFRTFSYGN